MGIKQKEENYMEGFLFPKIEKKKKTKRNQTTLKYWLPRYLFTTTLIIDD